MILLLLAAVFAAAAVRLVLGGFPEDQWRALLELRGWRVAGAVTVGASLATAGVMLQALLRNPLASPDLLGLASGAGLGVMIAVYVSYLAGRGIAYFGAVAVPAVLGAAAVLGLITFLSRRRGVLDPVLLVLIGVVVSIMCGAASDLVRHLMPDQGDAAMRIMLAGIRDEVPGMVLASVAVLAVAAVVLGMRAGPAMDVAAMGDDEARSVGVNLHRLRMLLFVTASVLAAGGVLVAGAVGFVGLIAPHLARLWIGPGNRALVPAAALIGALLVLMADALVRTLDLGGGRLPLNVLMTAVGGPVFIWMLLRARRADW